MLRRASFALGIVATIVASSILVAAMPAFAGGGPLTPNVRALLHRSVVATAAMKSAHIHGSISGSETANTHGTSLTIGVSATFRGDVSNWGKAAAHLQGQFRVPSQAKYFKLVFVGKSAAAKVGKSKWQCTTEKAVVPPTATSLKELRLIRTWLRHLKSSVRYADLGSVINDGQPAWHVRATLLERVDLASLATSVSPSASSLHLPKPWVHVKANFWISQNTYALQTMTLAARVRVKGATLHLHMELHLSRFGEHVPITLPAACSSGSYY